jgi:hypothetical protein
MGVLETLKATFGSALVAASCMGAALPAQAAAAAAVLRYEIKALAVPAGADALIASDLNDLGAVTGWVRNEGNPTPYGVGFVWRNGRTTLLDPPAPAVASPGLAINNRGEVAGAVLDATLAARPFVYRNGSIVDLRPEPVDRYAGGATDINNAGAVTGALETPGGPFKTFVHDGRQLKFLEVQGETNHAGLAINDAGDVLMQSVYPDRVSHYLYRDGQVTKLPEFGPDPDPGWRTFYDTMNNAGQLLGYVESVDQPGPRFIYNSLDGTVDFLNVPDPGVISPADLNDSGWVVGYWGGRNGFIYRDGQLLAFDELLRPDVRAQWSDMRLVGVNNAGQVIGTGLLAGPDGSVFRTFVATPVPEFDTAALMLAGLGAVAWVTRQRRGRLALAGPDLAGPQSQPA